MLCERSGNCVNCCCCHSCNGCPYEMKQYVRHPTNDAFGIIFGKKIPCRIKGCDYYDGPRPQSEQRYNFSCINTNFGKRKNKMKYTTKNMNKIINWCNNWFNNEKYKFYFWWLESGKNPDDPALHIHYIWAKNESYMGFGRDFGNHARDIKNAWTDARLGRFIEKDDYNTEAFTHRYLNDKLRYAINSSKDSHENFHDLLDGEADGGREGQLKGWNGCISLTAKFREMRDDTVVNEI